MISLVTGANGFTGAHVVRALLQRQYEVRGYVRASSDLQRLTGLDIALFKGDITEQESLRAALSGVDTVFHTAAYVDLGIVNQQEMHRVNTEGTRLLLEASLAAGVKRFVYCSTIGVFGDTQGAVVNESFQRSQDVFSSAYDETKLQAQAWVDAFQQRGLFTVSVLPSGIFGAGDPHFGPVIQRFLAGRLKWWAGGARITGIVHVEDVADVLILAAEKGRAGERYIASAGELSTRAMFDIMSAETGIPVPKEAPAWLVRAVGWGLEPVGRLFAFNPPLSRERVHYVYDRCVRVDAAKARRELGWTPRTPEQTIRSLVT